MVEITNKTRNLSVGTVGLTQCGVSYKAEVITSARGWHVKITLWTNMSCGWHWHNFSSPLYSLWSLRHPQLWQSMSQIWIRFGYDAGQICVRSGRPNDSSGAKTTVTSTHFNSVTLSREIAPYCSTLGQENPHLLMDKAGKTRAASSNTPWKSMSKTWREKQTQAQAWEAESVTPLSVSLKEMPLSCLNKQWQRFGMAPTVCEAVTLSPISQVGGH